MRSRGWLLLGIAIAGALALYASTQAWVTLRLVDGAAAFQALEVTGQQVNQSLSPVAIAALAAALALTIAGRVFRRILGVLVLLLGAGVAAIAATALSDPQAAVQGRLAEATGLSGGPDLGLIASTETSAFMLLALIAGIVLGVLGLLVLLLSGRWKAAGRKYEAESSSRPSSSDEPDRISDWEAQNAGDDPSDLDDLEEPSSSVDR